MDRRGFVKVCAGGAALALANWDQMAVAANFESFPPAKLTNKFGAPLKGAEIPTNEAMVFSYPVAGVPCFLINLGDRPSQSDLALKNEDGDYKWKGGVGPKGQFVAFVAICTHQLSYPQPEVTYLRYAADVSGLAGAPGKIVCCAHASVFEPTEGAKVVSGPATMPLLPISLVYDPVSDELTADGIMGMEYIKRFFKTFKGDLNARYGRGGYRLDVGNKTACIPLSKYSEIVPAC
ncbi:MAG: Rieske 2Fe-2S domain-containing protein [Gallionellaceae bacterium]|nr:Rieske 2Fe-2S domain-containing protein [Gallionellaceae bacterium]